MAKKHLSRRSFLGTSATAAAAGVLVGTDLASAATTSSSHLQPGLQQDTITLNVFVHDNHPFDRVKPIYEAQYPNVKLNMMKQNDVAVFRATLAA
ncbi:MAG TPA: twin-arginine translocation signal domain-containing protein, partial [Thermomicrobiales bacterium]|nr:twin-arginine translocation signal domain-containing protein [Thermomicrobiales bacterium]